MTETIQSVAPDNATTRFPMGFWVTLILLPASFFFAMYFVDGSTPISEQWLAESWKVVVSDEPKPPPPGADWQTVDLASVRTRVRVWV